MSKQFDWSMKVSRPGSGGISRQRTDYGDYLVGTVTTEHGLVDVYSEERFTSLRIVHNGRLHSRTIRKQYTSRGLVTLANRYAHEIVEKAMTNKQDEPTLEQVINFLLGEGELEGCYFGDDPYPKAYPYWWRTHLRQAWRNGMSWKTPG